MQNKSMNSVHTWVSDTLRKRVNEIMEHFIIGMMFVSSDGKRVTVKLPADPHEAVYFEAKDFSFIIDIYINKDRKSCFKAAEKIESLKDSKEIVILSIVNSENSKTTLKAIIDSQLEIASAQNIKLEEKNEE